MSVTSFERGVLLTLFEAGEENLPSLLNTARRDFPNNLIPGDFESAMNKTLQKFLSSKFIRFAFREGNSWRTLGLNEMHTVLPLSTCLYYDADDGTWHWKENALGSNRVVVLLEPEGSSFIKKNIS